MSNEDHLPGLERSSRGLPTLPERADLDLAATRGGGCGMASTAYPQQGSAMEITGSELRMG